MFKNADRETRAVAILADSRAAYRAARAKLSATPEADASGIRETLALALLGHGEAIRQLVADGLDERDAPDYSRAWLAKAHVLRHEAGRLLDGGDVVNVPEKPATVERPAPLVAFDGDTGDETVAASPVALPASVRPDLN